MVTKNGGYWPKGDNYCQIYGNKNIGRYELV